MERRELLNAAATASERLWEAYGKVPLSFEANQGQTDAQVRFLARGQGYALFLTPDEAVLSLRTPASNSAEATAAVLRMSLVGANAAPRVVGAEGLPGKINYFRGNDPGQWRTNVSTFARVEYQQVYPGIDLVYYGNQRQLEYDFIVAPGADPNRIGLTFRGADGVRLDAHGNLVLSTAGGELVHHAPVIYQVGASGREAVAGRYVLTDTHQVGFAVGTYDRGRPLVIDPVLSYSTYLGGNQGEEANKIAVDGEGSVYLTGGTGSSNFPVTAGSFQTTPRGNNDGFVTKINANGSALVWSAYLGGGNNDNGTGIAVDSKGHAYVTGFTETGLPTTAGAFRPNCSYREAYVTKIALDGSQLVYSTCLGAITPSPYSNIAVDAEGNAYVTGATGAGLPTTPGAFQRTYVGGYTDGFILKLNAAGSALDYASYLGGNAEDRGNAVAVDAKGNAYVTGSTESPNFPTTPDAFQRTRGQFFDGFVAKVSADGSELVYSTFLGGNANDAGQGIAVDGKGDAYVVGDTRSTNFPTTPGAFQRTVRAQDGYVTKLNASGSDLVYSTYLGGGADDYVAAIALDAGGHAYVTGATFSGDFPVTLGAFQTTNGGTLDAFVTKMQPDGQGVVYSYYLGGGNWDGGLGIAVDAAGAAYVSGTTQSTNFPTANPLQSNRDGGSDAFVTKFNPTTDLAQLSAIAPAGPVEAGTPFTLTIIARDSNGHAFADYRGTVRFTSSDGTATLPADYTFTAADRGAHTFTVTLRQVGSRTVTVTDTTVPALTLTMPLVVNPGPATTLTVLGFPATITAGVEGVFTVTLRDTAGNVATGYRGTVRFTSSDSRALLPSNYTFTTADAGSRTFRATLRTAGTQSLTATDTTRPTLFGTQGNVRVDHAALSGFQVAGFPSPVAAGSPSTFTVTAADPFGNVIPEYAGTVRFSSSDPRAVLPQTYTFRPSDQGRRTFGAALRTTGVQALTVTDRDMPNLSGTQSGIMVTAARAFRFVVLGFPSPTTAGNIETFTVTAVDRFGNPATGYRGTVRFDSTDGQADLPDDYTFTVADRGTRTFAAILKTAGLQALTARDIVDGGLTGTQANVLVNPAAAASFFLSAPDTVPSGVPFDLTVFVIDAYGNLVPTYVGRVSFTSSDPNAVLPADYTFVEEDQGVHTFPGEVTLFGEGAQSLTATDTGDPQLTGTAVVVVEPSSAPGGGGRGGSRGPLLDLHLLFNPQLVPGNTPDWTTAARPMPRVAADLPRAPVQPALRIQRLALVDRLFAAIAAEEPRRIGYGPRAEAACALFNRDEYLRFADWE